jgi:hypothetical protein
VGVTGDGANHWINDQESHIANFGHLLKERPGVVCRIKGPRLPVLLHATYEENPWHVSAGRNQPRNQGIRDIVLAAPNDNVAGWATLAIRPSAAA